MSDIYERLGAVLDRRFGVTKERFDLDTTFADLGFDSVGFVELALALQKEFGIAIDDDELAPDQSLSYAIKLLHTRI